MKMKDSLSFCFAVAAILGGCGTSEPGPAGQTGPVGQPGPVGPVDPKLTFLIPGATFLSRSMELQISGSGTHFTSGSTVDFGDPQITSAEITASGDNNLRLKVQIGASARLGAHDVTVTSGSESASLKDAFVVKAALQSEPAAQQLMISQGGLYAYNLRNLDYHDNPFGSATPTPSGFSVVSITGGGEARLEGVALIDALTPPGPLSISAVTKSPFGTDVLYTTAPTDSSLALAAARTPSTLTNNTARAGESLPSNYASNLYKLTTVTANQLLILSYSGLGTALTGGTVKLMTAVAPASGKFSQGSILPWSFDSTAMNGLLITELSTASDYYLATFSNDYSGAALGYTYTITPKLSTLTSMNNPEPAAETPANPSLRINSLTGAVSAEDGKLSGDSDTDYLVFTAANSGNVLLQVANNYVTSGPLIPLGVELYKDAACTMSFGPGRFAGPGQPATLQAAVTSGMTYCARFYIPFPSSAEIPYKILLAP